MNLVDTMVPGRNILTGNSLGFNSTIPYGIFCENNNVSHNKNLLRFTFQYENYQPKQVVNTISSTLCTMYIKYFNHICFCIHKQNIIFTQAIFHA